MRAKVSNRDWTNWRWEPDADGWTLRFFFPFLAIMASPVYREDRTEREKDFEKEKKKSERIGLGIAMMPSAVTAGAAKGHLEHVWACEHHGMWSYLWTGPIAFNDIIFWCNSLSGCCWLLASHRKGKARQVTGKIITRSPTAMLGVFGRSDLVYKGQWKWIENTSVRL